MVRLILKWHIPHWKEKGNRKKTEGRRTGLEVEGKSQSKSDS